MEIVDDDTRTAICQCCVNNVLSYKSILSTGGCEGSYCDEAYDYYMEQIEYDKIPKIIKSLKKPKPWR